MAFEPKAYMQAYYKAHQEAFKARAKKRYREHTDELRAYGRKNYQEHKEETYQRELRKRIKPNGTVKIQAVLNVKDGSISYRGNRYIKAAERKGAYGVTSHNKITPPSARRFTNWEDCLPHLSTQPPRIPPPGARA